MCRRVNTQIVAWHEGWKLDREEAAFDVLTERKVRRPVFSDPKTWEKQITVSPDPYRCRQLCPERKVAARHR